MNAYALKEQKTSSEKDKTGIPAQMKAKFERSSGFSFNDVRVHYNSEKPAQLRAHAYTQGSEVFVAPGQEKHLPHELGHVVQQKSNAVKPTGEIAGLPLNDDEAMEDGADKLAEEAENSEESDEVPLQAKAKDGGVVQRNTQDAYNVSAGPLAFIAALGSIGYAIYNYHKSNKHERKHRYIEEIEKYSDAACEASEEYLAQKELASNKVTNNADWTKAEAEMVKQRGKAIRNYTAAKNKEITRRKLSYDQENPGFNEEPPGEQQHPEAAPNEQPQNAQELGYFEKRRQEKKQKNDLNVEDIRNGIFNQVDNKNVRNALVRARDAVNKCRDNAEDKRERAANRVNAARGGGNADGEDEDEVEEEGEANEESENDSL